MTSTPDNGVTIQQIFYTLDELEQDCWLRLLNGSLRSKDAFHTASVASLQNGEINMRTVVLRKVFPAQKQLQFHTDIRSAKWQELQQSAVISLLFYDAPARIQLRIKGVATLHYNNAVADNAWQQTGLSSRRCYLSHEAPGSPSAFPTSGFDEVYASQTPTEAASEAGKQYFGVVRIQAHRLDWLWLNHAGHRRALFDYSTGEYTWLVP